MCDTHKNEIYRIYTHVTHHVTHYVTHVHWWSYFYVFPALHAERDDYTHISNHKLPLFSGTVSSPIAPGSCLCMLAKKRTVSAVPLNFLPSPNLCKRFDVVAIFLGWRLDFAVLPLSPHFISFWGWFDFFLNARLEVQGAWLCSALMRLAVANPKVEALCQFFYCFSPVACSFCLMITPGSANHNCFSFAQAQRMRATCTVLCVSRNCHSMRDSGYYFKQQVLTASARSNCADQRARAYAGSICCNFASSK